MSSLRRITLRVTPEGDPYSSSHLETRKSVHRGQCRYIFNVSFAEILILISFHHIYDWRRFRENLSRLNLRSSDGTKGGGQYDFVAQNEPAGFMRSESKTFINFLIPVMVKIPSNIKPVTSKLTQNCQISCADAQYSKELCFTAAVRMIWLEEQGSP